MAIIDLRNVTIVIQDGYEGGSYPFTPWLANPPANTGFLVNNVGGYTTQSTMLIDTGTSVIQDGATFTVVGDTAGTHTVTAHVETLGNTTSITFTPALSGTIADDAVITIVAAYPTGTTTMAVDGGTGLLADGDTFTISTETGTPLHTVSAHSETLGNTTSITFAPSLASAVLDDTTITILPHSQTVHIGEGNMTYSEKRKIKYVTDRGILNTVKLEEDQPLEAKLAYEWDFLTSSISEGIPTTEDVFKFRNLCANWVSTSPDKCEIPCVDIVLYNTPPCNGVSAEQIVLHMFRWEDLAHDPKAGTVDVTGKCNTLTALVSRIPT